MAERYVTLPLGDARPMCSECRVMRSQVTCGAPLSGRKAGQLCGRALCWACAVRAPEDWHLCPPHARAAEVSDG